MNLTPRLSLGPKFKALQWMFQMEPTLSVCNGPGESTSVVEIYSTFRWKKCFGRDAQSHLPGFTTD